jgi:hypothetical protein
MPPRLLCACRGCGRDLPRNCPHMTIEWYRLSQKLLVRSLLTCRSELSSVRTESRHVRIDCFRAAKFHKKPSPAQKIHQCRGRIRFGGFHLPVLLYPYLPPVFAETCSVVRPEKRWTGLRPDLDHGIVSSRSPIFATRDDAVHDNLCFRVVPIKIQD